MSLPIVRGAFCRHDTSGTRCSRYSGRWACPRPAPFAGPQDPRGTNLPGWACRSRYGDAGAIAQSCLRMNSTNTPLDLPATGTLIMQGRQIAIGIQLRHDDDRAIQRTHGSSL